MNRIKNKISEWTLNLSKNYSPSFKVAVAMLIIPRHPNDANTGKIYKTNY